MAKQTINIGSAANDGTGSTLRESFDITNDNFTELYNGTGGLFHKIEGANFTGSLLIGHATTGTLSSAQNNTGIGIGALDALTTGDNNIAIGQNAGTLINSGTENVFIGQASGDALTTGNYNVAIGHETLSNEDTHGGNTAIGHLALRSLNAGVDALNIAVGYLAGLSLTTGINNTLIGALAGDAITTGGANVVMGYSALSTANTDESQNVAIGAYSLNAMDNGSTANTHNTAVGYYSGVSVTTGRQNTILGALAGDALTTGINNTLIGYNAAASAVGVNNEITLGDSNIANVRIPSDSTLKIGASGDLQLEHLSGHSFIKNTDTGDLYIENQVDDASIIFRCDDGSGGLDTYFTVVGAGNRVQYNKNLRLIDNAKATFGSSDDLTIHHNGSVSAINNAVGDIQIFQNADDSDIRFSCDDGSGGVTEYFRLDGGDGINYFFKDIKFLDDGRIKFGTSSDLQIYHNGTNSLIENSTGHLYIKNSGVDKDIIFEADNGSGGITEYFKLDGGTTSVVVSASLGMYFNDGIAARFGNGGDFIVYHDATDSYLSNGTGDLIIRNTVDDKDIIFQSDDGSGGVATYFFLDGQNTRTEFLKDVKFPDNVKANFGTSVDLQIYHDGSNSYISDEGTGNLFIQASNSLNLRSTSGEWYMDGIANGAVNLYYDNVKKFETTSTGASITGTLTANTGHVNIDSGYSFQWGDTHERIEQSDGKIEFFANNTQQMTLSGDSLGIGTDSPSASLDIKGDGADFFLQSADYKIARIQPRGTGANLDKGLFSLFDGSTEDIRIDTEGNSWFNGGNIGIGTGTPVEKLDISAGNIRLDDNQRITWSTNDSNIGRVRITGNESSDFLAFATDNSERMRINSSGYIYIDTGGAEPSASQVGVRITGTQGQAFWNSANSGTTGYNHFNFYNGNGAVGSIVTNGSATAFNTSSDYRLKEDLKDFDGLDKVSKIPVYDFKWKVDDSRSYGVLAHELEEVIPNAVSGEKDADEMQGVDYSKVVPLLIKSIQELEARVKTLENK